MLKIVSLSLGTGVVSLRATHHESLQVDANQLRDEPYDLQIQPSDGTSAAQGKTVRQCEVYNKNKYAKPAYHCNINGCLWERNQCVPRGVPIPKALKVAYDANLEMPDFLTPGTFLGSVASLCFSDIQVSLTHNQCKETFGKAKGKFDVVWVELNQSDKVNEILASSGINMASIRQYQTFVNKQDLSNLQAGCSFYNPPGVRDNSSSIAAPFIIFRPSERKSVTNPHAKPLCKDDPNAGNNLQKKAHHNLGYDIIKMNGASSLGLCRTLDALLSEAECKIVASKLSLEFVNRFNDKYKRMSYPRHCFRRGNVIYFNAQDGSNPKHPLGMSSTDAEAICRQKSDVRRRRIGDLRTAVKTKSGDYKEANSFMGNLKRRIMEVAMNLPRDGFNNYGLTIKRFANIPSWAFGDTRGTAKPGVPSAQIRDGFKEIGFLERNGNSNRWTTNAFGANDTFQDKGANKWTISKSNMSVTLQYDPAPLGKDSLVLIFSGNGKQLALKLNFSHRVEGYSQAADTLFYIPPKGNNSQLPLDEQL